MAKIILNYEYKQISMQIGSNKLGKQIVIQIGSNKLDSSLAEQNQVCCDTKFKNFYCKTFTSWIMLFSLDVNIFHLQPLIRLIVIPMQLQHHGLLRIKHSKHLFQIGTSERKILIVLCYYILVGVITFSAFTVTARICTQFANTIASSYIYNYWQCETAGLNPENFCDRLRDHLDKWHTYPRLTSTSNILIGTYIPHSESHISSWRQGDKAEVQDLVRLYSTSAKNESKQN